MAFYDPAGAPVPLYANTGPQQPMVDTACRILDAGGSPLKNVYGIGLAAGFVPRGPLGGEASFRGQANGLWLWQHGVGGMIADSIIKTSESVPPRSVAAPPLRLLDPASSKHPMLNG
jgi:hypothetical protein